jgi:hypothetical protein
MAIYKFRAALEDNEDVYRDIEIRASQTFEDLFHCILDAVKFDRIHAGSFFVSDDFWRKNDEIALRKEDAEEGTPLMSRTKIAKYVNDPHQRFILVYDEKIAWTFLIELQKINKEEGNLLYPCVVKSAGKEPRQYQQNKVSADGAENNGPLSPDLLMANMLADPVLDDSMAYEEDEEVDDLLKEEEGVDEDDKDALLGEEGDDDEMFGDQEEGEAMNDSDQEEY